MITKFVWKWVVLIYLRALFLWHSQTSSLKSCLYISLFWKHTTFTFISTKLNCRPFLNLVLLISSSTNTYWKFSWCSALMSMRYSMNNMSQVPDLMELSFIFVGRDNEIEDLSKQCIFISLKLNKDLEKGVPRGMRAIWTVGSFKTIINNTMLVSVREHLYIYIIWCKISTMTGR